MILVQITAPHFCAGIVLRNGRVKETAPILRYMTGWAPVKVKAYCKKRGWTAKRVTAG